MNRRKFLSTSIAAAGALSWSNPLRKARAASEPPNIILIFSDDQGYGDAQCYPHTMDIQTPNIDRLARQGARFTQGYATACICSPSRAGLLTGRYQERFGYYGNFDAKAGIPTTEKLIGHHLKPAGYATACVGKWHLGWEKPQHPLRMGFDEFFGFLGGQHDYFDPNVGHVGVGGDSHGESPILDGEQVVEHISYTTSDFTERAVDFIGRHRQQPFFLYLAYNAIHGPLQAPKEYLDRHNGGAENRDVVRAMIDVMDEGIGKILDALKQLGIDDDTLIFFISDNGGPQGDAYDNWKLRAGKGTLFEGGIRVPFIVRWPKGIAKGKTFDAPVSTLDVLPTILAAAGLDAPKEPGLDGVDLLPYVNGENSRRPHELLFWSYKKGGRWALRRGDWKLVSEKKFLGLFDLRTDPGEEQNLMESEPHVAKEIEALYEEWIDQMAPSVAS